MLIRSPMTIPQNLRLRVEQFLHHEDQYSTFPSYILIALLISGITMRLGAYGQVDYKYSILVR